MPKAKKNVWPVLGLAAICFPCFGPDTFGQGAAAFTPNIGIAANGETMTVTPAVTADRRYVRLSVNAFFNTVNGFTPFTTPLGAVGGVGAGGGGLGGGGLGGLGGGGLGGLGGGLGGVGGGLRSVGGFGVAEETFNVGMNGVIGPAGYDGGLGFAANVYVGQIGEMRAGALPPFDTGLGHGLVDSGTAPRATGGSSDARPVADRAQPSAPIAPADESPRRTTLDETARSTVNVPPATISRAVSRHEKARSARAARRKKVSDEEPVIKPKAANQPPQSE